METFSIAPAATRALWVVPAIVVLVLALVGLLLGRSLVASRSAHFVVSPDGLQLRGDWYGRTVPWTELRGQDARRVEFAAEPGLVPRRRTMGTGLPGYQAGWFRLQNGERALLFLTDRQRAVYVPTTAGYSLLVSPADPDAFLAALRDGSR
jgi:hypothetical protein